MFKMTRYTANKCLSSPPKPEEVTCASLESNYKPYLKEIKRSFFKSLPEEVMCDVKCMELFKAEEEFPEDVVRHYCFNKAYAKIILKPYYLPE